MELYEEILTKDLQKTFPNLGIFKVQLVSTNTLKIGDLVVDHGGLFKVKKIHTEDRQHGNGHTQANICDFLGDIEGRKCAVPEHWRKDWNIQGNSLAKSILVFVE